MINFRVNCNLMLVFQGWEKFLSDEPTEFHNLPVSWEVSPGPPSWLRGSYIKNGPSQKQFGTEERWYSQYMDSWGKLHKLTFSESGDLLYSGRMIETNNYKKCAEAQRLVPTITIAGVKPNDWSLTEMMAGFINNYDNTNVLLWRLGPEDPSNATYIATTDFPLVHMINPDTLAVTGQNKPPISKGYSLQTASHWTREIGSDNSINYHLMMNPLNPLRPDFVLYRYGNSMDDMKEIGRFGIKHINYNHMISNTPNYAVIVIYPVIMNYGTILQHDMHPIETLERLDEPTKIYLMNLHDGSVLDGFETEEESMVFATHHMNAWEEGDEVIFDLATNPWDAMKTYMDIELMINHNETDSQEASQVMKRVRLNKVTREVVVEDWPNQGNIPMMNTMDFPAINMNYKGYKNRYAYGWVGVDYWRMTLVKKDLEKPAECRTWSEPNHYPGELQFVPNPEGEEEDDGILMTVVFDGVREQSYVLLLDGRTFTELNRAYLPYIIPFSFHGNWFPELR